MENKINNTGDQRKQKTLAFIANLPHSLRAFISDRAGIEQSEIPEQKSEKPVNRSTGRRNARTLKRQKSKKIVDFRLKNRLKREAHRRRECRYHAQILEKFPPNSEKPRFIPLVIWRRAWAIVADPSGRAAEYSLDAFGNRQAAKAIRDAATAYGTRPISRARARLIVALGLTIAALATAKSPEECHPHECRGIPQAAFLPLLRNPFTGTWPSLNAIIGIHAEHGNVMDGQIGYLRALEETGFCRVIKLRKFEVTDRERWGSHALARYRVIGRDYQPLMVESGDDVRDNWTPGTVCVASAISPAISALIQAPEVPPD